jgi:hypothetical protein
MKTKHKARKRDECQCANPKPVIVGFDGRWLPGTYCKRCRKELQR